MSARQAAEAAGATAEAHALRLYGVSKFYGETPALDDVTLDVAPGEFLTLLGPSGSGKTTLLMALAGFVRTSHGDILPDGRSIEALPPERRDFGVVFQGYALFPHMSVAANVAYPLQIRGVGRQEVRRRVEEALTLVRLQGFADRLPKQLSGGQQQRVALARALVFQPKVLLLDEPMGALDRKLRAELQVELRSLHRRLGATFVNVTHDQDEAMSMSDRIAIMRAGRIEQLGAPRELYDAPRSRFVAGFLGRSNFLTGRLRERHGRAAVVEVDGQAVEHRLRDETAGPGDRLTLALRPDRIRLGAEGCDTQLAGRIESAVFLGSQADLIVSTPLATPLAVSMAIEPGTPLPGEGDPVKVGWAADAAVDVDDD